MLKEKTDMNTKKSAKSIEEKGWDQQLLDHVKPQSWPAPKTQGKYNLVVIGAGSAGLVTAAGAAGLGAKVALIEKDRMGGDCLNFGCVPSKALLHAAHSIHQAQYTKDAGFADFDSPRPNFVKAMERMRQIRAQIAPHDSAARFRDLGVDVYLGAASFSDAQTIEVQGQKLKFARAVIATGRSPYTPDIEGLSEVQYDTNETIFGWTALPQKIAILGTGPIGCELAQVLSRFGAEVHMLSRGKQLLPVEDPEASEILKQQFLKEKIQITLGAKITKVEQTGKGKQLTYQYQGEQKCIHCDALIIATGRQAKLDGMGLDKAGIAYSTKGIQVDEYLRTTAPKIYAAGDVCSQYQFTHAADAMARIVIQNALFFGRKKHTALSIPWATYTSPEIAHIGPVFQELQQNERFRTVCFDFQQLDRNRTEDQSPGFAKVYYDPKKKGRIIAATIVGKQAGELIGAISFAITNRLSLVHFANTIYPYPTRSEVLKRLGDQYNRTRLTPWVKRLFEFFLRLWRR